MADRDTDKYKDIYVDVAKGTKKTPEGTRGRIFWIGEDKYRKGDLRFGIKDAEGETWWVGQWQIDMAEVEETANRLAPSDDDFEEVDDEGYEGTGMSESEYFRRAGSGEFGGGTDPSTDTDTDTCPF